MSKKAEEVSNVVAIEVSPVAPSGDGTEMERCPLGRAKFVTVYRIVSTPDGGVEARALADFYSPGAGFAYAPMIADALGVPLWAPFGMEGTMEDVFA